MKFQQLFSLIGLGVLVYMVDQIGFDKISRAIYSLDASQLPAFFLFFAIVVLMKGIKWRLSLEIFEIDVGILAAVRMWVIGFFIGAVTPGRAGDFAKVFYIKQKKSVSLGAALLDRASDLFAVILFAVIGAGVFGGVIGVTYRRVLLIMTIGVFSLFALRKYGKAVAGIILEQIIPKRYRRFLKTGFGNFYAAFRRALGNRTGILTVTSTSILIWMLAAVQSRFVAEALDIQIPYVSLLLIISITSLLELIPITVAGLGTREAVTVVLMSSLGIESEKALVFSLANFLLGYVVLAFLGYLLWLRNPVKITLRKGV